jgi:hypothetical protein
MSWLGRGDRATPASEVLARLLLEPTAMPTRLTVVHLGVLAALATGCPGSPPLAVDASRADGRGAATPADAGPPDAAAEAASGAAVQGGADTAIATTDGPPAAGTKDIDAAPPADGQAEAMPDGPVAGGGVDRPDAPPPSTRQLDLLFAIDNSPSMMQEQANLARNFPALIDELRKVPGGLPDIHIGIVSSDLGAGPTPLAGGCGRVAGDRGIFQVQPGCGLDPGARFLVASGGGTFGNFQGDLAQVFSCLAKLGTAGCGYEHQLQAARVALYETITPENKGFLRDQALLGIIFITDEDDCSAPITTDLFTRDTAFAGTSSSFRCAQVGHRCNGTQPPIGAFSTPLAQCRDAVGGDLIDVSMIVDSIRALKLHPDQQILVSGIFGWPQDPATARYTYVDSPVGIDYAPICTSANGEATAGLRMKAFVDGFGAHGSLFSICQDDFRPAMQQIGAALAGMLGP